jgi:hypothetical protein
MLTMKGTMMGQNANQVSKPSLRHAKPFGLHGKMWNNETRTDEQALSDNEDRLAETRQARTDHDLDRFIVD